MMRSADKCETPPILRGKEYDKPSVFSPENLLREARRQKDLPVEKVPEICVLDPDGDIVNNLRAAGKAQLNPNWACYHTEMYIFQVWKNRTGDCWLRGRKFICCFSGRTVVCFRMSTVNKHDLRGPDTADKNTALFRFN